MKLYTNIDEFNIFNKISNYSETSQITPFGYHLSEHIWSHIYSSLTNKNR